MKKIIFLPILFTLLVVTGAHAGTLGVGFNDYSVEVVLEQILSRDERGSSLTIIEGIYNDRENTKLFGAGLDVTGKVGNVPGLSIIAGIKGYYVSADVDDIAAGSLGGGFLYIVPGLHGLSIESTLYYCPKVFTFMDGIRMQDFGVRIAYAVAPRATVFIGYSNIRATVEIHGNQSLDETVRGGITLSF
ncbi:MAG: hypothetical protein KJ950_00325 [Proteobacteria bacterium]|nr:hypothetical protein [Pseudomonadota bacterium]MBU1687556.1 hypothetical protein [Pseudomonadota bacterium]